MADLFVDAPPTVPKLPPVATAWVPFAALALMTREADSAHPLESGGIMMGYWAEPQREVVITDALLPGPRAVHRLDGFDPDSAHDAAQIRRLYEQSGHFHTYLGEWHSHPASGPWLSPLDQRTLGGIAAEQAATELISLMAVISEPPIRRLMIWRHVAASERMRVRAVPLEIEYY